MMTRRKLFFIEVADKFAFRLGIYFFLVLLIGCFAFIAELILERYNFALMKHALADGLVTGFAVIVGLCLLELFLHMSRRLTDQLKAEARKADTLLTTIVQTIPDLVFVKDVEGRHLMVNKAVEEFTGLIAKQLYGKTMADLSPPRSCRNLHEIGQGADRCGTNLPGRRAVHKRRRSSDF